MDILSRPVLELNRHWVPIGTKTVRQAIVMACGDWLDESGELQPKARILDVDTWTAHGWDESVEGLPAWCDLPPVEGEPTLSSGRQVFRCPEIIVAGRYGRVPHSHVNLTKRNLLRRDAETCQYCGGWGVMTIDHVLPKSRGGPTTWENCVAACYKCNQRKANRLPEEANMSLLRKPVRPTQDLLRSFKHGIRSWDLFFGKD